MKVSKKWIFILTLSAFGAQIINASETIKIGGGAAPMENIFKKIKKPFEKATGIKLELFEVGPDKAMEQLESGAIDVAAAGLSRKEMMDLMKDKGKPIKDESIYFDKIIDRDLVYIVMNKFLKRITRLDKKQVKDVFTGEITNWKEVGGPDLAITLVYGTKITGTNKVWKKLAMNNQEWGANRVVVGTAPEIINKIIGTPGAIGLSVSGLITQEIHTPSSEDIERPVTIFVKGKPSINVNKLIEFIKQ